MSLLVVTAYILIQTEVGKAAKVAEKVVDPHPMDAIRKLASREEIDEIIVSTLPRRLSRWMAMDLPHRIRRDTKLPVTHISGPAGPSL